MSHWLLGDLSFQRRRSLSRFGVLVLFICCGLASAFYWGLWTSLSAHFSPGPVLWTVEESLNSMTSASSDMVDVAQGAAPSQTLSGFLAVAKKAALQHLQGNKQDGRPLVLIMGNGAGDLDSLSSAVSLSYLLSTYSHDSLPLSSALPADAHYVPLIQTARDDARLRPENIAAVAAAGIDQDDLLYLSDLTSSTAEGGLGLDLGTADVLSLEKGTYLGLVDHPQLELPWHGSSPRRVVIVVDHHADAGKHLDASLRVFREPEGTADGKGNPTGSAQSIVIELFAKEIKEKGILRGLADLAMAVVLIDTDNLKPPPRGRASKTDLDAMELLLPCSSFATSTSHAELQQALLQHAPKAVLSSLDASSGSFASIESMPDLASKTQTVWKILSASKNAISHLTTIELLKRDYKTSSLSPPELPQPIAALLPSQELKAGFSSVNLGLPVWLHRGEGMGRESEVESRRAWEAWWKALLEWMQLQKLTVAVVGTSFSDEEKSKHRRELVVAFAPPSTLPDPSRFFKSVVKELESISSPLELTTPWKGARLTSSGKKERVSGVDLSTGQVVAPGVAEVFPSAERQVWAQVWRQQAVRANRKVYLPTIMNALQKAAQKAAKGL